ncbi:ACT domain-containing protein [Nymphaea thermarum]|nr:ACT domain-containing protein [Nymphaea thermarum]
MGVPSDDVVLIRPSPRAGEPTVITVNCPDKRGLGCDLCRIILEFGLSIDRGDVTYVLTELEHIIHRVKVSTTPDGGVVDLFFITDGRELLHTKQRREDTCERLIEVLGESCQSCDLQLAGPEYEAYQHGFSSLPPAVVDELFSSNLSDDDIYSQEFVPDLLRLKKSTLSADNSLSPAHTLLQVQCLDHKCLLYDILRTLKDCGIKIAYGRFSSKPKRYCEADLFVVQKDGKKIVDPEEQKALFSRLRMEILHPLRFMIADRGPDTELLVANPVELCGKGRPRVFYDVTLALKLLGICIFSAEIGRHSTPEHRWEVYRFLLDDTPGFPLSNGRARKQILDRVRKTLMGW